MADHSDRIENQEGPKNFGPQPVDLRPEVADLLRARLIDIEPFLQKVGTMYAEAMLTAQVMEFAVKLAAAALNADPSDEEQSAETAKQWLNSKPAGAIRGLQEHLAEGEGVVEVTFDLLERARHKRNELAHDFWWRALPGMLSSEPHRLVEELEESIMLFTSVLAGLKDRMTGPALSLRSISQENFTDFVSLLALFLLRRGGEKENVNLKTGGDALVTEVAEWLGIDLSDSASG